MKNQRLKKTRQLIQRLPFIIGHEIWQSSVIGEKSLRGRLFSLLRVITITYRGLQENNVFGHAAGLSYYSLIGMGPLLAIGIMISSFMVSSKEDDSTIRDALVKLVYFIAPPTLEYSRIEEASVQESASPDVQVDDTASVSADVIDTVTDTADPRNPVALPEDINPRLLDLINQIVDSAKSGTVGILGSIMLIVIGIQLIISVENTFNGIWGIKKGRSWLHRLVFYWTIISLGAVLGFAALFLVSYSTILRFLDRLTVDLAIVDLSVIHGPMISFGIVMMLLTAFYKFMPNTKVNWLPALIGSFFVSALLFTNHYLSFLYAQRVITTGNLYGSVSIVLVFMLGLYVFWVIVLLGGQITYSVQNVNNLANQRAWENMSIRSRKALCLASMILTARRFLKRENPPTSSELSSALHVPSQVMNSCLTTLCEMNWLAPIEPLQDQTVNETRFQPSRPLNESTIHDFEVDFFNLGNNAGAEAVIGQSPLLSKLLPDDALQNPDCGQIPISRLLMESPEAFPRQAS